MHQTEHNVSSFNCRFQNHQNQDPSLVFWEISANVVIASTADGADKVISSCADLRMCDEVIGSGQCNTSESESIPASTIASTDHSWMLDIIMAWLPYIGER